MGCSCRATLLWLCLPIGPLHCVRRGTMRDDGQHRRDDCQDTSFQFMCCLVHHFYIIQDGNAHPMYGPQDENKRPLNSGIR